MHVLAKAARELQCARQTGRPPPNGSRSARRLGAPSHLGLPAAQCLLLRASDGPEVHSEPVARQSSSNQDRTAGPPAERSGAQGAWEQAIRLRDHAPVEPSRTSRWGQLWLGRWQFAYAVAGLALGAALVSVIFALSAVFAPDSHLWSEFSGHALGYGSAAVVAMLGLCLVGRAIGRRQDQLELSSATDPLTELPNRRYFATRLHQELLRASRYGVPVTLLLIDVDGLKQINDSHGHSAGDRALCAVADCLTRTCRAMDVPMRYGGDEFAVLVPDTFAEDALDLAKRFQQELGNQCSRAPHEPRLSISVGIADVARAGSTGALKESADRALYAAKAAGRNAIVLAPATRTVAFRPR